MPEGHTIHRLAARHRELFGGRRVRVDSPQGRFAPGAARIDGTVLRATEAYGKHLLHHHAGMTLHIHLGLYGQFRDGRGALPPPVGELRMRMTGNRRWLELRGPTACELLSPPEVALLRARLGADPLRDDADPAVAYERIARSPRALAGLLLDQSIVAGAGLVYVSEVLFRAGIAPPGRGPLCPQTCGFPCGQTCASSWSRVWKRVGSTPSTADTCRRRWAAPRGSTATAARCTSTAAPTSRA